MMAMPGKGTAVMIIIVGLIIITESQTRFCESDQCQTSWTPVPNMGAALVGYNPFIGNRLISGKSDPGKRNQIFSPTTVGEDGRVNVNDFLHFSDSVNCQILDNSIVVRNYQQYRQQKSGSYSFARSFAQTSSINTPFYIPLINFEKTKSSQRSSSGESSFERELHFFAETQGEIHMNEAKCETHRVAVDNFEKPVFTSAFISAMRTLQQAATTPTSKKSKQALRRFIGGYGTHFMAETWLGATMITETKFASASLSAADRRERQRCVRDAYSKGLSSGVNVREIGITGELGGEAAGGTVGASTTVGGWGINSGETYSKESEKCGGSQQDLSFFDSNQFKQSVINSVGSPPLMDLDEWAAQVGETPAAVRFSLKSIGNLFRPEWLDKIPLDELNPAAGNLDADLLNNFFEESVANYCEIMLGRPCPDAQGCGINGLCKIGEKCVDDSSNSLGFRCLPGKSRTTSTTTTVPTTTTTVPTTTVTISRWSRSKQRPVGITFQEVVGQTHNGAKVYRSIDYKSIVYLFYEVYDAEVADYDYYLTGEYDDYDIYDNNDGNWFISPTVGKWIGVWIGLGEDSCSPSSPCSCTNWNNKKGQAFTCQTSDSHRGKRDTHETHGSATLDLGAQHTLSTV